jgi:hypothetical protein
VANVLKQKRVLYCLAGSVMAVTTLGAHAGTLTFDADFQLPGNTASHDAFSTDLVETTSDVLVGGTYVPVGVLQGTATLSNVVYSVAYSTDAGADQKIFPSGGGYVYDLGGLSFDLLAQSNHAYIDTVNIAYCNGGSDCGGVPGYIAALASTDGGQFYLASYAPVLGGVTLSSGVPEPALWTLMLIGIGFAGFATRRTSRISAL